VPVKLVNSNGSPTKAILIIWRSRVRNSPPAHRLFLKKIDGCILEITNFNYRDAKNNTL